MYHTQWIGSSPSQRVFFNILSAISAVLGAVFGFLLYPIANILRLLNSSLIILISLPILIPFLAILAGIRMRSVGVFTSIMVSLLVIVILPIVVVLIGPLVFVYAFFRNLILSPLQGLHAGWNEGVFAVIWNSIRLWLFGPPNQPNIGGVDIPLDLIGVPNDGFGNIMGNFLRHAPNAAQNSLFSDCELPQEEMNAFITQHVEPLTDEEIRQLEKKQPSVEEQTYLDGLSHKLAAVDRKAEAGETFTTREQLTPLEMSLLKNYNALKSYKNLKRIETDDCPIKLERPLLEETVLLAKQFKQGEQWLPVPGKVSVFDKERLQQLFLNSDHRHPLRHPETRDLILSPSSYYCNGIAYVARYIVHPYYISGEEAGQRGICQEANDLCIYLRSQLSNSLNMAVDESKLDIAASAENEDNFSHALSM